MAFLKLGSIFKYLDATPESRCVVEGEALLSAKLLVLCGVTKVVHEKEFTITALCMQTSALSSTPHKICGELWVEGTQVDIKPFTCTCKAGLSGTCKHISACLLFCSRLYKTILFWHIIKPLQFYCDIVHILMCSSLFWPLLFCYRTTLDDLERLSSTDLECYWSANKEHHSSSFQPTPVVDFKCIKPVKKCRTLTSSEKNICLDKLKSCVTSSILYKHSMGICGGPSQRRVEQIEESVDDNLIKISEFVKKSVFLNQIIINVPALKPCCSQLLQILSTTNIVKALALSQNSDEWFEMRRLRITGSTCYSIFTYSGENWQKKSNSLFFPKKFKTVATEHGKKYEEEALCNYKSISGERIMKLGFLICEKFPWLGYSPDAVTINEKGEPIKLIEIKCPLKGLQEDANSLVLECNFLHMENQLPRLKKKHQYYGQVQLGMLLLNVEECDLIVYSPKSRSFVTVPVGFDPEFTQALVTNISAKYFDYMIHFACNE